MWRTRGNNSLGFEHTFPAPAAHGRGKVGTEPWLLQIMISLLEQVKGRFIPPALQAHSPWSRRKKEEKKKWRCEVVINYYLRLVKSQISVLLSKLKCKFKR